MKNTYRQHLQFKANQCLLQAHNDFYITEMNPHYIHLNSIRGPRTLTSYSNIFYV